MRIISIICLSMIFIFSCTKRNEEKVIEYTIIPRKDFCIYGYDMNKLVMMKFGELEKVLGCEVKVDSEVAVVFIEKNGDFIKKTKKTHVKDHIEFVYGPIEDLSIYKRYKEIRPNTICLNGRFLVGEDSTIKESIIRELKHILPENDETKQIIENIYQRSIFGKYDKDMALRINFNMSGFQFVEFSICFFKYDEKNPGIFYKYIFSLTKEPYPGF